jgi:HD-like signal output (HDOD) protein
MSQGPEAAGGNTATAARDQVVASAIREIAHIATLPEITLKIIQLVESPSSTAQDLHNVIAKDPALCTRILKVVNSAFYGLPGQIGSINRAIVLLGLNAVKNIAIAASLAKLFKGGQLTSTFGAKDLWAHSIATATATKLLADKLKLGLADEAFLAGLIHDVGIMVELQFDRAKLVEVVDRVSPEPGVYGDWLGAEQAIFGATHQDFGAALCEKWKFPRSFGFVTGYHHRPLELPVENRTLACLVSVGDHLAARGEMGFRLDIADPTIPADLLEELKLTTQDVEEVFAKLPAQLEQVSGMLS